ncbi:MAG TPA: hypothetical protein VFZ45_03580 [Actinomycetota bacterium]|nr:hypothetical protein [Actinomycetota bacterium]
MSRIIILALAGLVALTMPGLAAAGDDQAARLSRDEEEVGFILVSDDDGDGTDSGTNGMTGSKDSLDTTAERSRSKDKSGDKTGGGQGADRSKSKDRSRDNTNDHSVGVTTNT